MKKLFLSLLIILLMLIFVSLLTVYFALQPRPTTTQTKQINADAAQKSQQLAKRLVSTLKENNSVRVIATNQHEIDGLSALFHRAFPLASLDVNLTKFGASTSASIALPLPSFIRYLNIYAFILPSKDGLAIEEVTIGDINIDGELFLTSVTWLANTFVQDQIADTALKMIAAVEIDEQQIVTHLALSENVMNLNQDRSLLLKLRDDLALFGDVEVISFYYQSLSDFTQYQNPKSSIALYIRYLFDLANTRRSISDDYSAIDENQAALMALVIYFGADRFETLVGDVIIRDHEQLVIRNRLRQTVALQGRVDLQKHFIYSIALQLFSTHGASDALGEFKEFLDTNNGGSGFSFADLQADRAGTRLAMIVTKSEAQALTAQQLLSNITDETLLPSINGLQEGLNQQKFEQHFQDANSEQYQQNLAEIDNRLKSLPVYQLGWE